jgi:hypothetical protein
MPMKVGIGVSHNLSRPSSGKVAIIYKELLSNGTCSAKRKKGNVNLLYAYGATTVATILLKFQNIFLFNIF